jgi:hypothetical protein
MVSKLVRDMTVAESGRRDDADWSAQAQRRRGKMDKIEQCVTDVVAIANGARDHEQAKARQVPIGPKVQYRASAPRSAPRGL